jgi:hypothetical protein
MIKNKNNKKICLFFNYKIINKVSPRIYPCGPQLFPLEKYAPLRFPSCAGLLRGIFNTP